MSDQTVTQAEAPKNVVFLAVKWYGYVLSLMYMLYGGLKLVLGILDRDYSGAPGSIIALLVGAALLVLCYAFRDRRSWGWYGLVALNGVVAIAALFDITDPYKIPFLLCSAAALGFLFSKPIKSEFF